MSSTAIHVWDVLIVDDEPLLRQALARAFRRSGFRCDLASDGQQAQKLLADRRYDLVVTDLCMPHVNGHRLAVGLLEQTGRPIVFVVTGVIEPKIERDLRARGVDEIVFKPVDYSDMVSRAAVVIEQRGPRSKRGTELGKEPLKVKATDLRAKSDRTSLETSEELQRIPPVTSRQPAPLRASSTPRSDHSDASDPRSRAALDQIRRLEQTLLAFTVQKEFTWLWPVATLGLGVFLGWRFGIWTR